MGKVLIVDDIKNIRMLLTTCLKLRGYEVLAAENGGTALEIAKEEGQAIDIIFLDIRMQGMNGTEVLRYLRDMGIHCPVIIMTAFATIKNAIDCTKLGAAAYLQKPFSPERVNAVLDEVNKMIRKGEQKHEKFVRVDYLSLSRKLIEESRLEEAHEELKKALGNNPYDKEIYYLLAKVNEGMNKGLEAERFYKIEKLFD